MNFKYISALTAAALALVGCSSETMFGEEGADSVTTGVYKPGVEVKNTEKVIKQAKTRATYDISNYIVDFYAEGNDLPYATYTYSDMPGTVELPVGKFTAEVRSHEVKKAEWDRPYFRGVSEIFTINKGEIAEVKPIKAVFASVKVSVIFGEKLKQAMGSDIRVTVNANDEGSLVWTSDETRAGYFEANGSVTMSAILEGTINGQKEYVSKAFSEIAAGQHRIITFELAGSLPAPDQPSGTLDPSEINIDCDYVDVDLSGDVDPGNEDVLPGDDEPGKLPEIPEEGGDDPNPPTPPGPDDPVNPDQPIVFGGTLTNGGTFTTRQLKDEGYTVDIITQDPIADLIVQIISSDSLTKDTLEGVGLSDRFSLATDEQYFDMLSEDLGFPVGDEVKGKKSLHMDISMFMDLIEALGNGTNVFKMTVTDNAGNTKTLEFSIVY